MSSLAKFSLVYLFIKSFSFGGLNKRNGILVMSFVSRREKDAASRKNTLLYDKMETESLCKMLFYDEVNSTMDTAKELIHNNISEDVFAIIAGKQSSGRGTRGRSWISSNGNLMMSVVFKLSQLSIPMTLIPLKIGTILARVIESEISSTSTVQLKWPNDVLINSEKVCGVLIEIENNYVIVGIGCNVDSAPSIEETFKANGRTATCISRHLSSPLFKYTNDDGITAAVDTSIEEINDSKLDIADTCDHDDSNCNIAIPIDDENNNDSDNDNNNNNGIENDQRNKLYIKLSEKIAHEIGYWIRSDYGSSSSSSSSVDNVIHTFESYMVRDTLSLREHSSEHPSDGKEIVPLRINSDGTLHVEFTRTGKRTNLIAEYLY